VERLRDEWRSNYDVTLLDSRTGYTDAGGVCTILLPDVLVGVFAANEQSLGGLEEAIEKAQAGRQQLDVDRPPLLIVPLPSRFDGRVEKEEADRWMSEFTTRLAPYYDDWLPRGTGYRRVIERTRVPHVPYYSFGEKLAALEQSLTDPEGLAFPLDAVARLLACDLHRADVVLFGEPADGSRRLPAEEVKGLVEEMEARIEHQLHRTRRLEWIDMSVSIALSVGFAVFFWTQLQGGLLSPSFNEIAIALTAVTAYANVWRMRFRMSSGAHELRTALDRLRRARLLDAESPAEVRAAYEDASYQLEAFETNWRRTRIWLRR